MNKDHEEVDWSQKKKIIRTVDEKIGNDSYMSQMNAAISNNCLSVGSTASSFEPVVSAFSGVILPDGNDPVPLGSGVIRGMLGEGGMARVYKIWNEKLEIYRAVKLYHLTGKPELIKRFEMEMKISANLCHPNIIQIHSTGEWNGLPFIEMELIEGISLERLIIQNIKFPVDAVLNIGIKIADALCYAHNKQIQLYGKIYRGIIHRDLKPANILLSYSGEVKLLDFGIARPAEAGFDTISGNIVGTLPYLSPEQIDGKGIDQQSDIYSLGTVLYEMFTGEKTFPQTIVMDILKMKYIGKYKKIDTYSYGIPPGISRIVERCLNENKEKRFNSSLELRNELSKYIIKTGAVSNSEILKKLFNNSDVNKTEMYIKNMIGKKLISNWFMLGIVIAVFIFFQVLQDYNTRNNKRLALKKPSIDSLEVNSKLNIDRNKIQQQPLENKLKETDNDIDIRLIEKSPDGQYSELNNKKIKVTQINKLKEKYRKDDLYAIADTACKIFRFRDAIISLESLPQGHISYNKGMILLTYAYLEEDSLEKAEKISNKINSLDAFFCVIMGRLELARKNEMQALEIFQLALIRSSQIRSNDYIRSESVYYTALIYDNWFISDPSSENQKNAKIAWNTLKRVYTPDQERFKLAERKLSGL